MALDESINDEDYVYEGNEFKLLVEKDILKQFNGFKIDYSKSWLTRGFRIISGTGGRSTC